MSSFVAYDRHDSGPRLYLHTPIPFLLTLTRLSRTLTEQALSNMNMNPILYVIEKYRIAESDLSKKGSKYFFESRVEKFGTLFYRINKSVP